MCDNWDTGKEVGHWGAVGVAELAGAAAWEPPSPRTQGLRPPHCPGSLGRDKRSSIRGGRWESTAGAGALGPALWRLWFPHPHPVPRGFRGDL